MSEDKKEFVPKIPDYRGDGIAIWKAEDKNKNTYLKVKVLGGPIVNCFKFVPKEKPKEEI